MSVILSSHYYKSNKSFNWVLDGGFRNGDGNVKIESDNALLIDTLCNGLAAINNIAEVRMIYEWFYNGWKVKYRLILSDSNNVADCLAKEAGGRINQLVVIDYPPQHVRHKLEEDIQHALYSKAKYVEA
ncbi:hypothetical protein J1N35_015906 [Gossypium stocksii]|uniref:RNase H type-1 domain-containing protein n=1 Tax=Gossypium stocksii TaxID=47602 RepID=A0A9D3VXY6_9ROSI|nr:hypothetical protein J1N35_015906 [Gossypium stocksii]